MIHTVKNFLEITLIVGGGIRTKEQAIAAVSAGADIIVTGNVTETSDSKQRVAEIITAIKGVRV
jgi:phosphoglycerol geranylgeranyltransferase